MKSIVIVKAYCKPPCLLNNKGEQKYLDAYLEFWQKDKTAFPENILDLRFAESHVDADNHTRIYYTDLEPDKFAALRSEFEQICWNLDLVLKKAMAVLGIAENEIRDGWRQYLGVSELDGLERAFGRWKIYHCAAEYVDENDELDVARVESEFIKDFLKNHGDVLRRLKDWFLTFYDVDTLEDFSEHLNRFEHFPIKYFALVCELHGWKSHGLDFGEMCSDGNKTLVINESGKFVVML